MVGVASASLTARRRRAALVGAGAVVLIVILVASCGGNDKGDKAVAEKTKLALLPGGGRRIFPRNLVVAYYGAPQAHELGVIGIGSPARAGRKLLEQAAAYDGGGQKV